jgi:predicted glycosyltransferase
MRSTEPQAYDARFFFYSHDGLGLGHVGRNLALAETLTTADPETSVLVATSAEGAEELGVPDRTDILKLPAIRKVRNGRYTARRLTMSPAEITNLRASLLRSAVEAFRPGVALVDKHPFGIGGEVAAALETVHAQGGRTVLGLRDILDDPVAVASEWASEDLPARIAEYYDRVLVYGDPAVLDSVREYSFPAAVAERTRFCGYVSGDRRPDDVAFPKREAGGRPVVLATAGGGEDGFPLLRAFLEAAAAAAWDAIAVSGPQCSAEEQRALRTAAEGVGAAFRKFVPRLSTWFAHIDALVCMGGYNTLAEAVTAGTPTVCVPRVVPRREQLIRARAFERLGLVRVVEPRCLHEENLRVEVNAALGASRESLAARARSRLNLDGARRTTSELLELAGRNSVGRAA